ncbi:MAG TPA: patatin-like phospholipase family protein, partial [Blastocatellia bacterium]|nr:patatin-like phospholipase family protein [Blastocatellia bacterium]
RPRTAVVLSAGYFGFYAHAGFMRAVEECGLDYTAIAGSSAGAVVAALHASGVPAGEIAEMLLSAQRKELWDSVGAWGLLKSLARRGRGLTGLLRGERFEERVRRHLRVQTFAECPRALYVTALNLTRGVEETFSAGTIADKVRASCAYPFLMAARTIDGEEYWDGGFLSKVPFEVMVARERPERLVVHYLPTRADDALLGHREWAALRMMERALAISRKEVERHRLAALGELRERLTWVEPAVPRVSARDLSAGRAAIEAAYQHAKAVLLSPSPLIRERG